MLLIRKKAYARAGLIGNPSDGYHGKTLALIVRNFCAEVSLYEWDRVEVVFSQNDQTRFDSVDELVRDVRLHGCFGGFGFRASKAGASRGRGGGWLLRCR